MINRRTVDIYWYAVKTFLFVEAGSYILGRKTVRKLWKPEKK